MAKYLGSNTYSDIFFVAFRIPNFFRKSFAEGAFGSAFVPVFADKIKQNGDKDAMSFARNVFSIMLYFLLIFTLIIEIAMPIVIYIFAPGFSRDANNIDTTIMLTRITFPYLIFIFIVSILSGILNTFDKFFTASMTPIIMNASLISAVVLFRNSGKDKIVLMLSMAVFVAGILQLLWMLFLTAREKIFLYPIIPKFTGDIKTFLSKFFDSFLSSGIVQINSILDSIIATTISGAVSTLYYGDRVVQFPLALIGSAISVSALPMLSKIMGSGANKDEVQKIQENVIFIACFFGISLATTLFTLAQPIVELLFQRGQFTAENTMMVANILKIYSLALPFFILTKVFQTIFFAKKDTRTPMKISAICLTINLIFGFPLSLLIGVNGIVAITTLSSIVTTFMLFSKLIRSKIFIITNTVQMNVLKIIYISAIMGITMYCGNIMLDKYDTINVFYRLLFSATIGGAVFLLLNFCLLGTELMQFARKNQNN